MEELNSNLKAFRNDLLGLNTLQQDLREFRLRLIKVEKDLRVSRSTSKKLKDALIAETAERKQDYEKLSESASKLTEVNIKLEMKCERLEKQIAMVEAKSMLDTPMTTEVSDLITEFSNIGPPTITCQGPEVSQNVQHETSTGSERKETPLMNQFTGDPNPPPVVLMLPEKDPSLTEALESLDLSELTSLPLFNEVELENILSDGISASEDSDSGFEENQPPPPPILKKKAALWKSPHGKDPSDPSGLSCLCGTKREKKKGLIEHIRYFMTEWKFQCKLCNKKFLRHNMLHNHQVKVHKNKFVGSDTKRVGCRKCGVVFSSRGEHKRHLKRCGTSSSDVMGSGSNYQMDVENLTHQNPNEATAGSQSQYTSLMAPPTSPGGNSIDSSLALEGDFSAEVFTQLSDMDRVVHGQIMDMISGAN